MKTSVTFSLALLTLLSFLCGAPAAAQVGLDWDPQGLQMNRQDLESLLEDLEEVARSPAYSDRLRERASRDAELIRERLTVGDLRVGDRVLLEVEGEAMLPDTLPVEPGPAITLPVMGRISLSGVLRSELEEHLTKELSRFIQDPVVRAQALIRVSIQGSVGQPGFYTLPADMLVGEALMRAGGPVQNADLDDLEIQRGERVLWAGEELSDAMVAGRTLDQLNLRAGDEIRVSTEPESPWWQTGLRYGLPILSSLVLGIQVFGGF